MKSICVFLSSSRDTSEKYKLAADQLAKEMVSNGYDLIWGGASIGLMGYLAKSIQDNNGIVRGVLPKSLLKIGLQYDAADELIITKDMAIRKETMNDLSSAYIAFPGGFGTLEELFEVITLKQLGYHSKAIVILNVEGFYDHLLTFINYTVEQNFIKQHNLDLYHVCTNPIDAVNYINSYEFKDIKAKW